MRFLQVWLWGLVLILAGCATTTPSPSAVSMTQTQALQGLFGVVTSESSRSGHFTWTQTMNGFTLELYGPMGIGATLLTGQNDVYTLETADGKTYTADSPEGLMDDALGWSMPISGFSYWLWGEPAPDYPFTQKNNVLKQQGWTIIYSYQKQTLQKIVMVRDGVKVTIVFSEN